MNKVDEAVQYFKDGLSCSQAILAAYGPKYGVSRELAVRVASGFGGGMGMGETCGAVTGAFMVLGLMKAGADAGSSQGRAAARAAVIEFHEKFKARRGTVLCRELLGCDISTGTGMEQARLQGLFSTICPKVVGEAAELLEEFLNK